MTPAIHARDLVYAWPGKPRLLDIPEFRLEAGERMFLRGPSGSGKSTLLGLLGGVLTPQTGRIELSGTELTTLGAGARDRFRGDHLGFIFQMFNLIPYLSVLENVTLPVRFSAARAARIPVDDAQAEARRLLDALGLGARDIESRPVTELSMGQQQRVAAARALIGRPAIIIADEPTSALDADARGEFLNLLMRECSAQSASLLFVSHDIALGAMFDRVVSLAELRGTSEVAT